MAGSSAANSASRLVVRPQQKFSSADTNHGGYQASVEQRPPEGFWYSTFNEPINLFTFVLAVATVLLGVSTTLLWLSTKRLARDGERTAKQQLRAYVGPGTIAVNLAAQHISIDIRNLGGTPAKEVTVDGVIHYGAESQSFSESRGIIDPSAIAHVITRLTAFELNPYQLKHVSVELKISYVDAFERTWERTETYVVPDFERSLTETSFHFVADGVSSKETQKR